MPLHPETDLILTSLNILTASLLRPNLRAHMANLRFT